MKVSRWEDVRRRHRTPEQIRRVDEAVEKELLEMNLAELRKSLGATQVQLAEATGMSQPEISVAEKRSDHLLSTLRRYVEALGGELEVTAVVGGKRVRLVGV